MYSIKTLDDIRKLSESNKAPNSLVYHLEVYFKQLIENLIDDEPEVEFNLEPYGYIIILEPEDDVRNLENVGLNPQDSGLLGSYPEFVNLVQLEDISLYQIGVLYDNEYMQIFYVPVGMFDEEIETFLREYSEDCMLYSRGEQYEPR